MLIKMKKFIKWLKGLFTSKKLVSEKIVKEAPKKTKSKSGISKATFTKSGVSKSTVKPKKKGRPRKSPKSSGNGANTSGKSRGAVKK